MDHISAANISNALALITILFPLVLYYVSYRKCFKFKLKAREIVKLILYSPNVAIGISFIAWSSFLVIPFSTNGSILLQTIWRGYSLYFLFIVVEAFWCYLALKRVHSSNRSCFLFLHIGLFVFSIFLCWIAIFLDQLLIYWPVPALVLYFAICGISTLLYMRMVLPSLIPLAESDATVWRKDIALIPVAAILFSLFLFFSMMRLNRTVALHENDEPEVFSLLSSLENYHTFTFVLSMFFVLVLLIISFHVILRNMHAQNQMKILSVEVMEALSAAIDAKDPYTSGHSQRVAQYSRLIAEKLGLSEEDCENVYYYGLLHDVGKIHVPNAIINKPSRLTDEEFDVIKSHPGAGADILSHIKSRPDLAIGAHWHHERIDGRGYPDRITDKEIPFLARIIAVADAYDAMTSNRSYRQYLPQDVVREEIKKGIGTQFDEKAANCMLSVIDEDKEYKLHE